MNVQVKAKAVDNPNVEPNLPLSATQWPMVITEPASIEAEAIRALRTRIVAQHVQLGRRALAICTPSADSGCTFVATNLAAAASQIGINTALVDADLRSPGVCQAFGVDIGDKKGLSDYLWDASVKLDDILLEEVLPQLTIIPAGTISENPQELLSSSRFPQLVDQLLREYDLTIFDTTVANSCTDALRVANVASYSLIVGRKHKTFLSDIKNLNKLLRADRSIVIGSVLNDF